MIFIGIEINCRGVTLCLPFSELLILIVAFLQVRGFVLIPLPSFSWRVSMPSILVSLQSTSDIRIDTGTKARNYLFVPSSSLFGIPNGCSSSPFSQNKVWHQIPPYVAHRQLYGLRTPLSNP